MKPVFDYIDAHQEAYLARLMDYLRQPSISAHGIGMAEVADYLVGWLDHLGFAAFTIPYANADEANHAPNENLELARFWRGIKTGAALLTYLGRMRSPAPPGSV
jgi:acetylornithine deacetylase/succinyl-diaminopimelate desuccinylase-like protein